MNHVEQLTKRVSDLEAELASESRWAKTYHDELEALKAKISGAVTVHSSRIESMFPFIKSGNYALVELPADFPNQENGGERENDTGCSFDEYEYDKLKERKEGKDV